jgi:hypothetical protein
MSNIVSLEPTAIPARVTAARLGKVIVLAPYMRSLTDTPGGANVNSLNVVNLAGFPAPDAAPTIAFQGTGITGGPYSYYITFYDQETDTEGNPSAQSASLSPSNQGIRVTNAATNNAANSRVTHWRIYRNVSLGAVYFRIATVAIGTTIYDDTASDASISGNDPLELDNNAPVQDTYGSILDFRNFAFAYGPFTPRGGTAYDHRVTWSKVGNIDAWPTLNETDFAPGQYGIIRALVPSGPALLLYKDNCVIRWIFRTDPSGIFGDGDNDVVNTERGALNERCVVNLQGTHIVMDRRGIFATRDGSTIDDIVHELDADWKRINWGERHKFCATWDDRKIWFFVALDEDSDPKHAFVLDVLAIHARKGQRWFPEEYDFAIRDAGRQDTGFSTTATIYGMERKLVPVVIDDRMRTHVLSLGWRDGVSPELTAEGAVAASGSTTTIVEAASGTFTATNIAGDTVDVKDMYLRFRDIPTTVDKTTDLDWERAYRITNVNGVQLTVTPAMPVAPPPGTTFWIGARPNAKLRSPQLTFARPNALKMVRRLVLEIQPCGVNVDMRARYSLDRMGWIEMQETSDSGQSRYTTQEGSPDFTVKLGGNFTEGGRIGRIELPGCAYNGYCVQVEFDASGPDRPVVIDDYEFDVSMIEVE